MSTTVPRRLEGRVAIVTGAGGGIGGAVAARLAAEGASVVLDDIREERVTAAAEAIRADGGAAIGVVADVSRKDEVDGLFDRAIEEFGSVDILVNNAGRLDTARHFLEVDEEHWDNVQRSNQKSMYLCDFRAAHEMARRGGGAIIHTSSGGATRAHRGNVQYDAAKGAIEAMTRALALDLAPYGIRVNAVAPGAIDIAPPGAMSDEEKSERGAAIPLGRMGVPQDLGGAYAFLASEDAAYVTGQVLVVDGGQIAQLRSPQVEIFAMERYPAIEPIGA
ncbi:SDR family NAD(P)-dependent oxidoreductase [Conexibacter woesei]|uniref:Short-chain dehydrogenase/reductase SDR n=1 Tax=Conexibacter woesei (strain DSM 14684 / CCUG 47730 / CIP 108061 / JCM 11494 / NBRC 100937 / ID131577) TaxID=469383 RepID=D3F9D6_CONWI|nr:glucose 1-dehydrogenase [Conexibacter woesei]ADB49103.1 short-chain dehydrogenase/reductase SDR [Conexibacter woesei DSM 14684]